MDLLYQGVVAGRDSLARWVELARRRRPACSGCTRRKGVIAPGRGRRHRRLRPRGPHDDRRRQDPPHEHGLLGLRGHAGRGRVDTVLSRGTRDRRRRALRRRGPATASTSARPVPVPALSRRSTAMDFGRRPADRPAGRRVVEYAAPGRADRLQLRLDLRLAPAVAGALRHLQPDPGADPHDHRRPDGDQPGDPGLDGDRRRCSPRSTRCTATARSAGSGAATRPCGCRTASRRRSPRCARRST